MPLCGSGVEVHLCGTSAVAFLSDISLWIFPLWCFSSATVPWYFTFATSLWNLLAVHLSRYFLVVLLCGSAVVVLLCGISVPVSLSLQLLCFSAVHLVWYVSVIIRGGIFC